MLPERAVCCSFFATSKAVGCDCSSRAAADCLSICAAAHCPESDILTGERKKIIMVLQGYRPAKKCQVFLKNNFCWTVKLQRRTRGTFMSAFSNKSFSHYRCVEEALPFSAVAQRLL